MVPETGLRQALRRLDRLPAGPALAAGLGIGALLGVVSLRYVSAARIAIFVALVAAAAPLALSARPVAEPAEEAAGEWERPPLGKRIKAALLGRAMLPALLLAALLGIALWSGAKGRTPRPMLPAVSAPEAPSQ